MDEPEPLRFEDVEHDYSPKARRYMETSARQAGKTESQVRALEVSLHTTKAILKIREEELLELKGPCNGGCLLHYAHRGPCDIQDRP